MAFGAPTRYIELDPSLTSKCDWDQGIERGNAVYSERMHNICCDNCHSHVGRCLSEMGYKSSPFGMVYIAVWFFFRGKFTGLCGVLKTFLPFIILSSIIWSLTHAIWCAFFMLHDSCANNGHIVVDSEVEFQNTCMQPCPLMNNDYVFSGV